MESTDLTILELFKQVGDCVIGDVQYEHRMVVAVASRTCSSFELALGGHTCGRRRLCSVKHSVRTMIVC